MASDDRGRGSAVAPRVRAPAGRAPAGRAPAGRAPAGRAPAGRALGFLQVTAAVVLIGAVVTGGATRTAWSLNQRNERALLQVQTRQAGAVISATILSISGPLVATLQIAEATHGDVAQFERSMSAVTGPGQLFASAQLLAVTGSGAPTPLASVGSAPELSPQSPSGAAFVRQALHAATFVVTSPGTDRVDRVAYAVADPQQAHFIVYAERAIPPSRLVSAEANPAFADLDFATYLGSTTSTTALATTDVPLSRLPLTGNTVRESIPFGNTTLTLVASPARQLGGPLGRELPWIFLAVGSLLTVLTAIAAARLVRRRRGAEQAAATIADLYSELDALYAEQRSIAVTLQRALLPRSNPDIPGLEIASRYVAGAQGVDIGGDWYSLVALDDTRFAFVVGDVSGRGVSAAAVMAQLRFTMRAYLLEGHPPDLVLQMCSQQLDVLQDGHFATALVGLCDLESRELALANAGHFDPLVVTGTKATYLVTNIGPPLGVEAVSTYPATKAVLPAGSVLVAFTDGLVERRGEDIDAGRERLAQAATVPAPTLDAFLTRLVEQMTDASCEDDIAVLAFGWRAGPG